MVGGGGGQKIILLNWGETKPETLFASLVGGGSESSRSILKNILYYSIRGEVMSESYLTQ